MNQNFVKRTFKSIFTSAMILGAVGAPLTTLAQDYDTLINNTQLTIDQLSQQQAQLYTELALGYEALATMQEEAEKLLDSITEDNDKIEELEKQIEELEDLIGKRESLLAEQARAVQATGGTTNYLNAIATSESISDFVGRLDIVRKMVSSNKDLLTTQREDKEAVVEKKEEVETAKEDKVTKQVALEALKAELQTQQENQELVYQQLTSDLSLAAQHRDALIAEKQAWEEQQAILAAQAQAAAIAQAQAEAEAAQALAEEAARVAQVAQEEAEEAQRSVEQVDVVSEDEVLTEDIVEVSEENVQAEEVEVTEAVEETYVTEEVVTTEEVVEENFDLSAEEEAAQAAQEAQRQAEEAARIAREELEAKQAAAEEAARAAAEAAQQAEIATGNVQALLSNAAQFLGTPYVWGGKTPSGFDCSGFVQYVFNQTYGIDVGGWTGAQESAGTMISVSEAQPGDLYFWGSPGGTYHVAIATGGGNYIHASQPGTPLEYNTISNFTPTFALRVNLN